MGDLSDAGGKLYSHGMASIALCEAYAMTNDPELLQPAQFALELHLLRPGSGGWRLALRAEAGGRHVGHGLAVDGLQERSHGLPESPPPHDSGRQQVPGFRAGRERCEVRIHGSRGRAGHHGRGPVVPHVPGVEARRTGRCRRGSSTCTRRGRATTCTTTTMPRRCCATTAVRTGRNGTTSCATAWSSRRTTKGHETGSWYFSRDPWPEQGGRLYCTSMATMILEVYYRHLPIYGKQAAEEDFPL